jgi:spermidine/putrescine transport system ATP-binding protein
MPALLLLDEPLGALDRKLRREMQAELKRIQREVGTTFVFVTHDQEEALTMSDRIAVMNDGRLQQLGRPADIYEAPANTFVAGFIGASNLLAGTLDGNVVVIDGGIRMQLPAEPRELLESGRRVVVSIRPEKIAVGQPAQPSWVSFEASVIDTVYLGASTSISLDAGGTLRLVALQSHESGRTGPVLQRGERVPVSWDPDDALVLDENSNHGRR